MLCSCVMYLSFKCILEFFRDLLKPIISADDRDDSPLQWVFIEQNNGNHFDIHLFCCFSTLEMTLNCNTFCEKKI